MSTWDHPTKTADKGWCDWRSYHKPWEADPNTPGPKYGDLSRGLHPTVRCPRCNKRLKLRAGYCIGGEFTGWKIPDHKPRVTRKKSPKRKTGKQRRNA